MSDLSRFGILMPCPRCSESDLDVQLRQTKWRVVCKGCGCGARNWYVSAQLAVDFWNNHRWRCVAAAEKPDVVEEGANGR